MSAPKTYTVRVERTIITLVTCVCEEPPTDKTLWEVATDEQDVDEVDWRILRVKEET